MRTCILATCLLMLAAARPASAAGEPPSPEELAIRENAQKYVEAFNRGDAEALAALWRPQAVYVDSDTGERIEGRPAIQEHFARMFAGEGRPQLSVAVTAVRFITPDVAIEDGLATLTLPAGEEIQTSYTAVSVKQDGTWLLDSIRETALPPPPTPFDHLQPLAFLVGEWVHSSEGVSVHSVIRWSANGAFLTQTFNVMIADRIDLRGTQVIGWDPAQQTIRSWMFDSDGGFGEGTWQWDGKRWLVQAKSTLPDGRIGSAINVYRPIDAHTVAWKSTARQVGGELLPNVEEVLMVRVQSEAQATPPAGQE